jgi:hypothetical protein
MRTHKIIKEFGTWAVTTYGVESLQFPFSYAIKKDRINENENGYTWEKHMEQKNWVNINDFKTAMNFAREYFVKNYDQGDKK